MIHWRLWPVLISTGAFVTFASVPAAASPQGGAAQACCTQLTPPGASCCIGQWEGPYDLGTSCADEVGGCQPFACSTDEIAHAALIPTGSLAGHDLAGRVIFWTACTSQSGYTTHIWNPAVPDDPPVIQPEILSKLNPNGALVDRNGPFCSGHAWFLDAAKNPKLLTVGGVDGAPFQSGSPCVGSGLPSCGLDKVYWFDPLATSVANAWRDDPADLGDGRWYPSVTTSLTPDGAQFLPLVAGGSWRITDGCDGGSVPFQHTNWWTLPRPLASSAWSNHGAGSVLKWHSYPRTFLLTDGTILSAGNVLICEEPYAGASHRYGGRPVRLLHPGQPHVLQEGADIDPNPSEANPTVGAWHYASGAILHTLTDFTYDEVDPVAHYDLNRVLMSGGSQEHYDSSSNPVPPQPFTLEWRNGTWLTKSPAPTPRVYGNLVILPDRRLLAVGGTNSSSEAPGFATFHADAELFDPGLPSALGSWKEVKDRPNFSDGMPPAPRGYHHVAFLLQDGRVAVMGGKLPANDPTRSDDTVEVYKPPYAFEGRTSQDHIDRRAGHPLWSAILRHSRRSRARGLRGPHRRLLGHAPLRLRTALRRADDDDGRHGVRRQCEGACPPAQGHGPRGLLPALRRRAAWQHAHSQQGRLRAAILRLVSWSTLVLVGVSFLWS
jgi:hypothetical protein